MPILIERMNTSALHMDMIQVPRRAMACLPLRSSPQERVPAYQVLTMHGFRHAGAGH